MSHRENVVRRIVASLLPRGREMEPEEAFASLRQNAVTPAALALACADHRAEPGAPCWGRRCHRGAGVCMARVRAGIREVTR